MFLMCIIVVRIAAALTRRNMITHSSSIGNLLQHQAYDPAMQSQQLRMSVDSSVSAPFACEKQSFLRDTVQKRHLEQQLMHLHVDKEQVKQSLTLPACVKRSRRIYTCRLKRS